MTHQITHLGAEHSVTGSCHLLQVKGLNILIDCGLVQGHDVALPMEEWPLKPSDIHYLFLTHSHIDHIGRVPELILQGFSGEILCTRATKALMQPMLEDAMSFSELSDAQTGDVLRRLDELSWDFDYDTFFDLKQGVRFKFGHAGHILGSCFIRFEWSDPEFSLVFSGDLGASHTPILPDPAIPDPCDLLIMESTYGDRCHQNRDQRVRNLGEILTHALSDGGKVFIPAFSLGRTQELLYEIDRLFSAPEWQQTFPQLSGAKTDIPLVIDSPLGLKITDIYAGLSEFWDQEAQELFRSGDHPLDFEGLFSARDAQAHRQILDMPGPSMIIASSGMCSGGRIVNHLREGLGDAKNDILFVGYQAKGTPGRDILRYSRQPGGYVRLRNKKIVIKAKVHVLSGYSAHADQQDLIDWVEAIPETPKQIKLIHGEPDAQQTLREHLEQRGYTVS
ncbi:MAG: MBL fold metallo-hydrolase [bacterium]|nr:MBL fold metallo-hydrolase [bacterium]